MALIKLKLPATDWSNAAVVVDYFPSILYPGEWQGQSGSRVLRTSAVSFLNTLDNGVDAVPFQRAIDGGAILRRT